MPDGSVIYATAAAGNAIYRGDRLPQDLVGDYLHGEGRRAVVRRLRPVKTEGLTQLQNVYPRREFIRSLDPLFRPVDVANAPDGTIYIADMYRGVIEGAPWAKEGHLPAREDQAVSTGQGPRTRPRLAPDLRGHGARPDQAAHAPGNRRAAGHAPFASQRLVARHGAAAARAEAGSFGRACAQEIVRTSTNSLARFHALWTLEGLGSLDAALARELLKDKTPVVRAHAIRASESLYKAGRPVARRRLARVRRKTRHRRRDPGDADAQPSEGSAAPPIPWQRPAPRTRPGGIDWVGERIVNAPAAATAALGAMTADERTSIERGATIYSESCFACHGETGRGAPMPGGRGLRAPALAGSARVIAHRDSVTKTILHGLSGPLDGRTYAEVMAPMGASSDRWIADVASFIRNGFGNSSSVVSEADVARVRKENRRPRQAVDRRRARAHAAAPARS